MIKTSLTNFTKSTEANAHNLKFMPAGVSSINRLTDPHHFRKGGGGAYMWDETATGISIITPHSALHFLGHNPKRIIDAVETVFRSGTNRSSEPAGRFWKAGWRSYWCMDIVLVEVVVC